MAGVSPKFLCIKDRRDSIGGKALALYMINLGLIFGTPDRHLSIRKSDPGVAQKQNQKDTFYLGVKRDHQIGVHALRVVVLACIPTLDTT